MAEESTAGHPNEDADSSKSPPSVSYYLMKAEPDSRIVKGKDVKFSVDDFETAQTTAWEGVRNYEARNIMQGMKIGDKVLFYHSNTKNPGIAGIAEVSREAYPDHTAWDEDHPYYDAKSNSLSPKWYMVDLRFVLRVPHFVSLSLLRHIATLSEAPEEMEYLSAEDLKAIRDMALLNKGRLSVQKVDRGAWDAVNKIAKEGDGGVVIKGAAKRGNKVTPKKTQAQSSGENGDDSVENNSDAGGNRGKGKREARTSPAEGTRRSKRSRK